MAGFVNLGKLTCCWSKLCSIALCCPHSTPKLARVLNVENHISRPRAKLNIAHTMTSHDVILRMIRFLVRIAPGIVVTKVKKIKAALAIPAMRS